VGISTFTGDSSYICENGTSRRLAIGATFVRGIGRAFHHSWDGPHEWTLTCIDTGLLKRVAAESDLQCNDVLDIDDTFERHDPTYTNLIAVLAGEAKRAPYAAQALLVQSVATALAARLLVRFRSPACPAIPHGALSSRAFAEVRAFIEDNVGEHISLEDLARVAGVSRFYFARRFRLLTGESPMGYLLRLRIERAKGILRNDAARVCDIAVTLGFADQSHFTRAFRRMVGVPPSEFRRRTP